MKKWYRNVKILNFIFLNELKILYGSVKCSRTIIDKVTLVLLSMFMILLKFIENILFFFKFFISSLHRCSEVSYPSATIIFISKALTKCPAPQPRSIKLIFFLMTFFKKLTFGI